MRSHCRKWFLTIAASLLLTLPLAGCFEATFGGGPKVAIPANCNKILRPVPHADVENDHAKLAWAKSDDQLDKANGRIERGARCWQRTVNKYATGK